MKNEIYLTHYILQSCGWIKIAEHACVSKAQVERTKKEILEVHPKDTAKFEERSYDHNGNCIKFEETREGKVVASSSI